MEDKFYEKFLDGLYSPDIDDLTYFKETTAKPVRTIASANVMTTKEKITMLIPILIVMGIVVVSLIVLIGGV